MLHSTELQESLQAASLSSQLDRGTEELESPPLEATFVKVGWSGCQGMVAKSKHVSIWGQKSSSITFCQPHFTFVLAFLSIFGKVRNPCLFELFKDHFFFLTLDFSDAHVKNLIKALCDFISLSYLSHILM